MSEETDESIEEAADERPTWIPPSSQRQMREAAQEDPETDEFQAVPPSRHRFPSHRRAFSVSDEG